MAPPILKSSSTSKQQHKSVSFQTASTDQNDVYPSRKRPRTTTTQQEEDADDDDVYGVDTTYDEGGTASSYEKFHGHRAHNRQSGKAPKDVDKEKEGDGEQEVDATYSLLNEKDTGVPIESFNLQDERTNGEGYFDGGMYVFRRRNREEEEEDAWLQSLEEQQKQLGGVFPTTTRKIGEDNGVGQSSSSSSGDEDALGEGEANNLDRAGQVLEKARVVQQILALLATPKETISDAMRRYGRISKLQTKQKMMTKQRSTTTAAGDNDASNGSVARDNANQCLQRLTSLANTLVMTYNENDVYEKSAEELQLWNQVLVAGQHPQQAAGNGVEYETNERFVTEHSVPDESSRYFDSNSSTAVTRTANIASVQWEYCGQDGNIHGPFSTDQMLQWIRQGYFIGESAVRVRKVHHENACSVTDTTTNAKDAATVEDLMADLEDSDHEDNGEKEETKDDANLQQSSDQSEWMRSDEVDFSSYL